MTNDVWMEAAGITVCLQLPVFGIQTAFWTWKLDPFRCEPCENPDWIVDLAHAPGEVVLRQLSQETTGFFQRRVELLADGSTLWTQKRTREQRPQIQFHMEADGRRIHLTADETESSGMAALEFLTHLFPMACLNKGMLPIHSALVEHQNRAFAICAASGVGKTTHARLWRDHRRAMILNGDRAVLEPGYDGWIAHGTPWSGTSGEQMKRSTPLGGIVLLERGAENRAERISPREALPQLMAMIQAPAWDMKLRLTVMDLLDQLLTEVLVYRLICTPDPEAVDALEAAMSE